MEDEKERLLLELFNIVKDFNKEQFEELFAIIEEEVINDVQEEN